MPRNPDRIKKVLDRIEKLWRKEPDLRLAQIVVNAAKMAEYKDITKSTVFYMEDDVLLKGLDNYERIREDAKKK